MKTDRRGNAVNRLNKEEQNKRMWKTVKAALLIVGILIFVFLLFDKIFN